MTLEDISKPKYRKQFNRVMIVVVIALFGLALGISQLLIAVFPSADGNHFSHNLSGVITAGLIVASVIYKIRYHPSMYEVMYVWKLKQELNRIYRKQKKLLAAVDEGDRDAMIIMNFSYHGSTQLYELDDNKVTMDELNKALKELEEKIAARGFEVSLDEYRSGLLEKY